MIEISPEQKQNDVCLKEFFELLEKIISFVNLELIKSLGIDENSDEIQKLIDLKIPRMQIEFLKKL